QVPGKRRVFYRVVAGDTLVAVARALAVASADLAAWNALEPDANLQARMVLLAWVAPDFDADKHRVNLLDETQLVVVTRGSPEHLDLAEARTGRVRTEYTAQGKEKLADVAKKFGMGSHDLARINRISYDTVLTKGQTIIVYQVADPSRSKRADDQWKKTPRVRRGKLTGARAAHTASTNLPDEPDPEAADDDAAAATPPHPEAHGTTKHSSQPDTHAGTKHSQPDTHAGTKHSQPDTHAGTKRSQPDTHADPPRATSAPDAASGPVTDPAQLR
ncbi:MAG: LysM peptidoglycan-binding domain-containing protein, partial [Deltaproteobacteria bacterium]